MQKFFKEPVKCYGLGAQEIRGLARELYQEIKTAWTVEEAIRLCEILLPQAELEAKSLASIILAKFKDEFPESLFFKIEGWLARNYCDNWASVDGLCPEVVGSLLEKYPRLIEEIKQWAESPNRWVRRASIVSFIKLARKSRFLDEIYEMAKSHLKDRDGLIQKANGWLLREAGKRDMSRLERFLIEHGPMIPRTTLRYAIERFDEKKRKELLLRTR